MSIEQILTELMLFQQIIGKTLFFWSNHVRTNFALLEQMLLGKMFSKQSLSRQMLLLEQLF
jgi:hypothetical protein